jgi:hypothetical protein
MVDAKRRVGLIGANVYRRWGPSARLKGMEAEGIDEGQSSELDVVLDGVVRYSYNRSHQRWHLLWAQPVLERSLCPVEHSFLGRGEYG